MVVKRKSVKKETTMEDSSQSEVDARPPVTQVVEVVEETEDDESTHTAIAEPTESREPTEALEDQQEGEEKRRVLMDELFQKKADSSVHTQPSVVTPEISVHRKSRTRPVIMWAIILIVASAVVGGIILSASGKGLALPSIIATPTPTPSSTPTPTPTPDVTQLDRSTLSVQVLNGSGVVGAAGKMKALLEEKGYTVDNTGNAETYDYASTEILVKAESEAFITLLEDDLKETYSLGTSEATLTDDVPYDVRIIIGKE